MTVTATIIALIKIWKKKVKAFILEPNFNFFSFLLPPVKGNAFLRPGKIVLICVQLLEFSHYLLLFFFCLITITK